MKRILALTAILALMVFAVNAGAQEVISGTLSGSKVSATQANTTVTFNTANGKTTGITVYNSSSTNEVFINVNAAAVAATSVEIPAGGSLTLTSFAATSLGVICSAGETATVYVYATYR